MRKKWKGIFCGAVLLTLLVFETLGGNAEGETLPKTDAEAAVPGNDAQTEQDFGENAAAKESVFWLPVDLPEDAVYTQSLAWEDSLLTVSWFDGQDARASLWDCRDGSLIEESAFPDVSMGTIRAAEDGMLEAYNADTGEFLVIGEHFQVSRRITLPEAPAAYPVLSPDRQAAYYTSEDGSLKRYDTAKRTAEILAVGKEADYGLSAEAVLAEGRALMVSGWEDGVYQLVFYDTRTWDELGRTDTGLKITSSGQDYTAFLYGSIYRLAYGNLYRQEQTKELVLAAEEEYYGLACYPEAGCVLTSYELPEGALVLSFYNLETGIREAVTSVSPLSSKGFLHDVTLLYFPNAGQAAVVCGDGILIWRPEQDQTGETLSRSIDFYRGPEEQLQELTPLKEEAGLLSDAYGVEIYMGDQCERDFFDYTAEPVYEARLVEKGLEELKTAFGDYPRDFFRQLGEGAYGALKIYLVGALAPAGAQGISDAAGLYFCSGNEQYLVLNLEEWASMRQTFYHETAHAIDCYINGTAYQSFQSGEWESLNPEGFSYAYSYAEDQEDLNGSWVAGLSLSEPAYFVDTYSKTFPAEDRARILEYAMAFGDLPVYFQEGPIQQKLSYLCSRIREAFDTAGWPEKTLWEAPLKENLKDFEKTN